MSKSDETGKGIIFMGDDPTDAAKKIMAATTDSLGEIHYDMKERPGISNLLQILSLLTKRPLQEVIAEWEGKSSYGELKKVVADQVETFLAAFQQSLATVDENAVRSKLEQSEAAMNKAANDTLLRVQKAVGLRV
jgi:tryptophanyl-tRNA synthetase